MIFPGLVRRSVFFNFMNDVRLKAIPKIADGKDNKIGNGISRAVV